MRFRNADNITNMHSIDFPCFPPWRLIRVDTGQGFFIWLTKGLRLPKLKVPEGFTDSYILHMVRISIGSSENVAHNNKIQIFKLTEENPTWLQINGY